MDEVSGPGLDPRVQALIDKQEIQELAIRYAHCVFERDIDGLMDLFTPDAKVDLPPSVDPKGVSEGRAVMAEVYSRLIDLKDPWPLHFAHLVELKGATEATGIVYAQVREGRFDYNLVQIGVYDDEYVKTDGKWRLKSRQFRLKREWAEHGGKEADAALRRTS